MNSIGCSKVSLSGLFPLDASSHLPFSVMTSKNVFRHCQMSFGGKKSQLRTTILDL